MIFLICSQLIRHPLIKIFYLSNLLQMTIEWLMLNSLAISCVVVRGSASVMLSVGHCQLPITTALLIFKALVSFAKLLEPPLHCMFISSSWTKCVVDVASYLHCSTIHLNLNKKITQIANFCLTSYP